jgi:long-chain acyl-CoA synthetase
MKKDLKLYSVPEIRSVQDMVLQSAKKYGPKIALEDLNQTPIQQLTYESLLNYVLKFGEALRKLGIKERSHIAVIGENRVQWGITYLSAMCFNYVIVPIDKNLNTNEILNIVHESDATTVVCSEAFHDTFRESNTALKKLRHYISMDLKAKDGRFLSMTELIAITEATSADSLPDIDPDELAEIIFTSGSLGRAKGVMLTQKNLASNLMAMVSMLFIYPHDRFLSVLPMHHTYECTCGFLCPLYCGASAHYARSLKTIVDDLQKVKATILLGVPLLYDKMFKAIQRGIREKKAVSALIGPMMTVTGMFERVGWKGAKKTVFKEIHHKFGGSVRIFIAGGAAPDPLVAKGLREFGFTFLQGYGLTETSPILALNRIDACRDDAAGLPLPGVELHIHEPDNEGIGEIWAKGPNIMPGYYNNENATRQAFADGWFRTGDIGYLDRDRFLHICGRMKNVIIAKNGKNVFPEEIEDILNRSSFVKESLVSGEKDEKQGEVIAVKIVPDAEAFIELSEVRNIKITPELVRQMIMEEVDKSNKYLPAYKQIRKIHIRENEFEKTTTQKIKRYVVHNEESVVE